MILGNRLRRAAVNWMAFRRPLSVLLQRLVGFRIVSVQERATGLSFRCHAGAEAMLPEVCYYRLYDIPLAPVAAGDIVVDVGANHGFASCRFAQRGALVAAFEPNPEIAGRLRENVRQNGLEKRIKVQSVAIGNHEGEGLLRRSFAFGGGSSSIHDGFVESTGSAVVDEVCVPVQTLASALALVGIAPTTRIRLLKLDCEGSELEVLSCLTEKDLNRLDSVALEIHPPWCREGDLVRLVRSWRGFHISKVQTEFLVFHLVNGCALGRVDSPRTSPPTDIACAWPPS